jgi:hypothetical protein
MSFGLIDILNTSGFTADPATKLVRHQDKRYPVEELRRKDELELYQSYQGKPKFDAAKQIISFYGLPGSRAGFYGVYNVLSTGKPLSAGPLAGALSPPDWLDGAEYYYDLKRDKRFDEFRDRLIIDWGPAALAWVQALTNKPVLEILPPGRKLAPFDDYLEFCLTHAELTDLFTSAEAHRDWSIPLGAVAGIYLILAQKTGHLYVGSAYGADGIWGRWRNYSKSGDGGNVKLRQLIKSDSAYPAQFRFSVLQILPKTMKREEILKREALYKRKLGARATGLNS